MTELEPRVECLVVDTGAFLELASIEKYGKQIYAVENVVGEVRDAASRRRLAVLPYDVEIREPDCLHIATVTNFSKKTGDFPSLSATDIQVIALTLELYLEKKMGDAAGLNLVEPVKKDVVFRDTHYKGKRKKKKNQKENDGRKCVTVGFVVPEDDEKAMVGLSDLVVLEEMKNLNIYVQNPEIDDNRGKSFDEEGVKENSEPVSKEKGRQEIVSRGPETLYEDGDDVEEENDDDSDSSHAVEEEGVAHELEALEEDEDESIDDDEGWITPKNLSKSIKKFKLRNCVPEKLEEDNTPIAVACLTTDFAMQNVLLQMGLPLVSLSGRQIRQTRTYMRRCFACFKLTDNMVTIFCPHCGHKGTLKRVSVSVKPDGTKIVHINYKKPLSTKGMRYSRPLPQGGKHAHNEIVSSDQRFPDQKPSKKAMQRTNVLNADFVVSESPFAEHDVSSRSFMKGYKSTGGQRIVKLRDGATHVIGTRKNPNEPKSNSKRKKKVAGFSR